MGPTQRCSDCVSGEYIKNELGRLASNHNTLFKKIDRINERVSELQAESRVQKAMLRSQNLFYKIIVSAFLTANIGFIFKILTTS